MTEVMELTTVNLQEIRARLEGELARLQKQLNQRSQPENDYINRNPNRDDLASSYTMVGQQSALQTLQQKKLEEIEHALQRMNAGIYGKCAACSTAIAAERLAILPTATLCVACQQRTA